MKRFIVIGASACVAFLGSLMLIAQAGAAPDQTGQTFAEAKAALRQAGYAVVVSTSVGDKVTQDQCMVTRQETTTASGYAGSSISIYSQNSPKPRVLLSLDCNAQPAQPKS